MTKEQCVDCGKELGFIKFTLNKEWRTEGHLCQPCYYKRLQEDKTATPREKQAKLE